ncbi:hypothetical protein GWI33_003686 [Rhynchophorus ferrugineus]|uniref:Uncharacterized protein n=1 Tax=Rhynchophorus ferrugineus TaxID=354439 RepID=A0A834M0D8_RHYFE|nr:hypothetical protein GWI33_003686 [Rhynchophorus ferrugineus]
MTDLNPADGFLMDRSNQIRLGTTGAERHSRKFGNSGGILSRRGEVGGSFLIKLSQKHLSPGFGGRERHGTKKPSQEVERSWCL